MRWYREYWKITGPACEGTLMAFPPDPRNVSSAKAVVEEFKAEGYTPYTYAAIQAFAHAAEKPKSVKLYVEGAAFMTTQTVVGPLTWYKKGDIVNPKYVFHIWKNGTYAEM